jgi:isoquinoline 1-oxidoreductase subunit beta
MTSSKQLAGGVTRRSVLQAGAGVGLVLQFNLGVGARKSQPAILHAWFQLAPDGTVSIFVNSTDIGQGSQSGMAQVMADELGVEWQNVRIVQAPIEPEFFKGDTYSTGNSGAISKQWDQLRRVGAAARCMLIGAACSRWKVREEECQARAGRVLHVPSGRTLLYGELASAAAARPRPSNPPLKTRSEWTLIGRSLPRLDIPSKVDGSAIYAIDIKLPGMRTAAIAQCPIYEGRLVSMNEAAARAVQGVSQILRLAAWRDKDYVNMPLQESVVVVADSYWQATRGLIALAPQWEAGEVAFSTDAMWARLREDLNADTSDASGRSELTVVRAHEEETAQRQQTEAAFANAARIIEAEYELPQVAHATMEPQAAVARWTDGRVEIWSGIQAQSLLKEMGARKLDIPAASITVRTTLAGGGFGRRFYPDSCLQAAVIAREVGVPVKVIWSRTEDLQHDIYRPPAVARFSAAISRRGAVSGVRMRQARLVNFYADSHYRELAYEWPAFLGWFSFRQPKVSWGAWRSVEDAPQYFFIESFIDELAHALKVDTIAYRRQLLSKQPRALRVLNMLAERSGWGRSMGTGRGQGVAFCIANGSYLGQVAEVSVIKNVLTVDRVTCVFDCGTVVNPDSVIAQGEGSILFGLSAARFEEITFKEGRVTADNFNNYRVVRLTESPMIEVHLLESPEAPVGGVGEPMTAAIAPAVANAIFAATGRRIRKLPFSAADRIRN